MFGLRLVGLALLLAGQAWAQSCTEPTVRRDWRTLSAEERSHFIDVQQALWRRDPDDVTGIADYDRQFTMMHRNNTQYAHQVPAFLPWHRRLLRDYEAALRTIDPAISLPYWNWAADAAALTKSAVFADDAFGGDGDAAADDCVMTGRFANWTLLLGSDTNDVHCLRRIWSGGFNKARRPGWPPLVPTEAEIAGNITDFGADFDGLRRWLEPYHNYIHLGLGGSGGAGRRGDMTLLGTSPNEPLFWLHHAFVDRIWWQFQQQGQEAEDAYGGRPSPGSTLDPTDPVWHQDARRTDLMPPWNEPVEWAFYPDASDYCYVYDAGGTGIGM